MKKLLGLILVVGMMFGISGHAFAAFIENDLLMTVYNATGNEVTVDLGNLSSTAALNQTNVTLATAGTIGTSQFGGLGWSDMSLAFYAAKSNSDAYYANTNDTLSARIGYANGWSFDGAVENLYMNYSQKTTGNIYTGLSTDRPSYYRTIDNNTSPGSYSGVTKYPDTDTGEALLDQLQADGYVDMYLYHIDTNHNSLVTNSDNQYSAVIRLNADGSTVLNPTTTSSVPIPPSILLFGSAFFGLFGIRRKNAN